MNVSDIRSEIGKRLAENDFVTDKSGVRTIEIPAASFTADEPVIFGEINHDWARRELDWYKSQSRNVYDIEPPIPEIWKLVADEDGIINSNYGWCVLSEANGHQYDAVLDELSLNPWSRRAVMIYTRPQMHIDYNAGGRSDFMCFRGDTIIKSPEGDIRIDELVQRLESGERYPVFSVNFETEQREISWAIRGKKKGRKKITRVHFDDGTSVDTTGDHRFFVRKRIQVGHNDFYHSYDNEVQAKDLRPGDSMITPMIHMNGGHLAWKKPLRGGFTYDTRSIIHREYYEWRTGEVLGDDEIHHRNEDKIDNSFDNLERMKKRDHRRHHMIGEKNSIFKMSDRTKQLAKMVETNKKIAANRDLSWYERRNGHTLDEALEVARKYFKKESLRNVARGARAEGKPWVMTLLNQASRLMGISKKKLLTENCKVIKVEELEIDDDVYDIEVEGNHNFFVGDNGVLVHNCTNAVQYLIRDDKLHAIVQMRSSDLIFGYKGDLHWQKEVLGWLSEDLGIEPGTITWQAGSAHVYERHFYLVDNWAKTGELTIKKDEYRDRFPDSEWVA